MQTRLPLARLLPALALVFALPLTSWAQTYPYPVDPDVQVMPDDFIFFVDGANVDVEEVTGVTVVSDDDNPDNRIARFGMGSWTQRGFFFEEEGINMTAQIERGDTLFFRLRIPEDVSQHLSLTIRDFRDENENIEERDLEFSVNWPIPAELYSGTWHDMAVPLPFPTRAEQDSAKVGKDVNGEDLANPLPEDDPKLRWSFGNQRANDETVDPSHPLWRDLTWHKVAKIGVAGQGSGYTWFMDDVYIGSQGADLSVGTQAPTSPIPLVTTTVNATQDSVTVTWTHDPGSDIFGYRLFWKGQEITSVTDEQARVLGNFTAEDELSYTFPIFSPHPNLAEQTYHVALTGANQYSFIPDDAPVNGTSITTAGRSMPYIYALTAEQEAAIVANFDAGTPGPDGFDTSKAPFEIVGEFDPTDPENHPYNGLYHGPDDASANVWIAYRNNVAEDYITFYIYAEVMDNSPDDDLHNLAIWDPEFDGGSFIHDTEGEFKDNNIIWNVYLRDQLAFFFGTYEVDDYVTGATGLRERGENPDYFVSFQPYVSSPDDQDIGPAVGMLSRLWLEEGSPVDGGDSTYYYNSRHPFVYPPTYEEMTDADGNRTGYRFLAAIDADDLIADPGETDARFVPPADDEIIYIPFSILLVDKDDDHISGRGNFWEVPSTSIAVTNKPAGALFEGNNFVDGVGTVAVAGIDVTAVNNDERIDLPGTFDLAQNYPNPFTRSTRIRFEVPNREQVTLTVYNLLGQQVAVPVDAQDFAPGTHQIELDATGLAAGMYFYRIEAGEYSATRTMTLLK